MVSFNKDNLLMATALKMKVEVWSDIMCPFCYIGKRNYETALKQFADSNHVEIEWHSFQLDPTIPPSREENKVTVYQYLADKKGLTYQQSVSMHQGLIQTAKNAGLTYNFEKAIVANSLDAHKMIQLAKEKGLGDEAEERLFLAYFTEGKDFGRLETLIELGTDIGLKEEEIMAAILSEEYAYKVKLDIQEAQNIGVRGVPFFVFNRKYAISGAQPPAFFLQTLEQSFKDWRTFNPESNSLVVPGNQAAPGC